MDKSIDMNEQEKNEQRTTDQNEITGEEAFDGGGEAVGQLKDDADDGITRDTDAAKQEARRKDTDESSGKSGGSNVATGDVE